MKDIITLTQACREHNLDAIVELANAQTVAADNYFAFKLVCELHQLDIIKIMCPHIKDFHVMQREFNAVCAEGQLEIAQYFVSVGANIYHDDMQGFKWACQEGHMDVVAYLLDLYQQPVDPQEVYLKSLQDPNSEIDLARFIDTNTRIKKFLEKKHVECRTQVLDMIRAYEEQKVLNDGLSNQGLARNILKL